MFHNFIFLIMLTSMSWNMGGGAELFQKWGLTQNRGGEEGLDPSTNYGEL